MIKLGVIEPSDSEWSSALHMVPKKTETEDHAEITEVRTLKRSRIDTLYHTYRTLRSGLLALRFSRRSTSFRHITIFGSSHRIYTKQQWWRLSDYSILLAPHLVNVIRGKLFKDLSITWHAVYTLFLCIWTTCSWQAQIMLRIKNTYRFYSLVWPNMIL